MIKRRGLITLGVLAFLWTLISYAPAAILYGWFAPRDSTTQLLGIEGTLREGQVAGVVLGDQPVLRDLHWQFQPWWLLLGRASFHVDSAAPLVLRGRIGLSALATHISSAHVSAGLKSLLGSVGLGYLPIDGVVDGDIDSLTLKHNIPVSATATLQLRGLNWSLAKPPVQLGDFRADISNDGADIVAKIQSTSGPIDAQGLARLNADGSYDSDIRMKTKPQADEMTQNLMHSMGQPDAQGYYHARGHGQLPGVTPAAAGVARPPR